MSVTAALTLAGGLLGTTSAPTAVADAAPSGLVANGGFEHRAHGWSPVTPRSRTRVAHTSRARSGQGAGIVRAVGVRRAEIKNVGNPGAELSPGVYRLTAWVRAPRRTEVVVKLRHTVDGQQRRSGRQSVRAVPGRWTRVRVWTTVNNRSATLTPKLELPRASRSRKVRFDDVRLTQTRRNGSAPGCRTARTPSNARGIPAAGAHVGATVSGETRLKERERYYGRKLSLHRSFFQAGQVDSALKVVREDHANGRLPWISFKVPHSWAAMANGKGDAWAKSLATRLGGTDGPVWLAFHHEPEGDGPMKDWTRMQRRLAPIVKQRADNVAYSIILVSWNMFFSKQEYRLQNVWPGDDVVDLIGMDMYNDFGATRNGREGRMLDPMQYYRPLSTFAKRHGKRWAVAELGYTAAAQRARPGWLSGAYRQLVRNGGVGMAYFDSTLNSIADWSLDNRSKRRAFKQVLNSSVSGCR